MLATFLETVCLLPVGTTQPCNSCNSNHWSFCPSSNRNAAQKHLYKLPTPPDPISGSVHISWLLWPNWYPKLKTCHWWSQCVRGVLWPPHHRCTESSGLLDRLRPKPELWNPGSARSRRTSTIPRGPSAIRSPKGCLSLIQLGQFGKGNHRCDQQNVSKYVWFLQMFTGSKPAAQHTWGLFSNVLA